MVDPELEANMTGRADVRLPACFRHPSAILPPSILVSQSHKKLALAFKALLPGDCVSSLPEGTTSPGRAGWVNEDA